jgi:organic hydroperoxide reductase OsmC/OhrA
MDDVYFYNTNVEWKVGRQGELSLEGFPTITVATPPEFPQGVPNTWSPEHLFVASANICLMTTFLAIAENSKLKFSSYSAGSTGKMERVEGKYVISEIELKPRIVIQEEKDREKALRIIEKAEKGCLISRSMNAKTILSPEIIVEN